MDKETVAFNFGRTLTEKEEIALINFIGAYGESQPYNSVYATILLLIDIVAERQCKCPKCVIEELKKFKGSEEKESC